MWCRSGKLVETIESSRQVNYSLVALVIHRNMLTRNLISEEINDV
jgi:hypothetical protein